MPTITCDTTLGGDGNVHAVVFQPRTTRNPNVWDGVDVGDTVTIVDEVTGATSTGTLAAFEVSTDVWAWPADAALRIQLTITPD